MKTRIALLFLCVAALAAVACSSSNGGDDDSSGDDASGDDDDTAGQDRVLDYITSTPYPRLVMEIDYAPGMAPREEAMDLLTEQYALVLDKPAGIEWALDNEIESQGSDHQWTMDEVKALADETDDMTTDSDTVKMHFLFLDGAYNDSESGGIILGYSWSHLHVAVFKQTIEEHCGTGLLTPSLAEKLCTNAEFDIAAHEVGHLIGLVNNDLPMAENHEDPDHAHHCNTSSCLMYWSYDGESVVDLLREQLIHGNDIPLGFTGPCLADIAAARGD